MNDPRIADSPVARFARVASIIESRASTDAYLRVPDLLRTRLNAFARAARGVDAGLIAHRSGGESGLHAEARPEHREPNSETRANDAHARASGVGAAHRVIELSQAASAHLAPGLAPRVPQAAESAHAAHRGLRSARMGAAIRDASTSVNAAEKLVRARLAPVNRAISDRHRRVLASAARASSRLSGFVTTARRADAPAAVSRMSLGKTGAAAGSLAKASDRVRSVAMSARIAAMGPDAPITRGMDAAVALAPRFQSVAAVSDATSRRAIASMPHAARLDRAIRRGSTFGRSEGGAALGSSIRRGGEAASAPPSIHFESRPAITVKVTANGGETNERALNRAIEQALEHHAEKIYEMVRRMTEIRARTEY